jgi:hypothetical protein
MMAMVFVPVIVSCAGSGSGTSSVRPARTAVTGDREPQRLLARESRAGVLRSLPPTATFAWVSPTTAFAGITAKEASTEHAAVEEAKIDAAAVLRANGWRETTADSAQFHLTMVRTERSGQRTTTAPDPRNDQRPPQKCDKGVSNLRNPCYEDPSPSYPPVRTVSQFSVFSMGYSIQRVSDGASAWWVTTAEPKEARNFMARKTVELLLAIEKYPQ